MLIPISTLIHTLSLSSPFQAPSLSPLVKLAQTSPILTLLLDHKMSELMASDAIEGPHSTNDATEAQGCNVVTQQQS